MSSWVLGNGWFAERGWEGGQHVVRVKRDHVLVRTFQGFLTTEELCDLMYELMYDDDD